MAHRASLKLAFVVTALGAAFGAALPAQAAVTTLGGSSAGRDCFLAAELKRDFRSSLEVCNRALSEPTLSRRDYAATLVNRGIVHMQARNLEKAIADYQSAIRLDQGLAEAHVNYGIALLHRGGADRDAVVALTRGLEMNPARPEVAFYTRAVAHEMLGNVREAYEDYHAAAAARPDWQEPVEQLKRFSTERRPVQRG